MTEQRNVAAPSLPREYELSQMISGVVCAVQEYSESIPRGDRASNPRPTSRCAAAATAQQKEFGTLRIMFR